VDERGGGGDGGKAEEGGCKKEGIGHMRGVEKHGRGDCRCGRRVGGRR